MIHIHMLHIYIYIHITRTLSIRVKHGHFPIGTPSSKPGSSTGQASDIQVDSSLRAQWYIESLESLKHSAVPPRESAGKVGWHECQGWHWWPVASIHLCLPVSRLMWYTFILTAAKLSTKRELGWCLKMFVTNHPHPVPRHCYRRHRHQYYYHYQTIALGFSATNNLLSLLSRTLAFFRGWRQPPWKQEKVGRCRREFTLIWVWTSKKGFASVFLTVWIILMLSLLLAYGIH